MKNSKAFNSAKPTPVRTGPTNTQQEELGNVASLVIHLPVNATTIRAINFTKWLGQGINDWVWVCAYQLQAFLDSKSVEASTVRSYWQAICPFFEFILLHGPHKPGGLKAIHIRNYREWLGSQGHAYSTQKSRYDRVKQVVSAMARRGVIETDEELFPPNPFPGSNRSPKGQATLSMAERARLAQALRSDIIAIHRGEQGEANGFQGTTSQALVVYLLGIAIRCGVNTTPLLEASRDCLQAHPFLPTMRRLILYKRRGNSTKIAQLRYSQRNDAHTSVQMDGVALITKVLSLTNQWVSQAKPEYQDRLWLYPSESNAANGEICVLKMNNVFDGIRIFVRRHGLLGDDGHPLKLNLQRLRKTVEGRLFDLSGADLIATAALMGHTPQVADNNYLACTQSMRENATFVGEALLEAYTNPQENDKVAHIQPTPAGRCKDPWNGDKAPKDGEPCSDFLRCFECRSYAITGHPSDLHRLFQTYNFLRSELEHANSEEWKTQYRNAMNLIDRFSTDKFGSEAVAQAKEKAKVQPSKFWSSYTLSRSSGHA